MFKQTYGFDCEHFKDGIAIKIADTYKKEMGKFMYDWQPQPYSYANENMSGTYLVKQCFVTELWTTNIKGEHIVFPIRHFIGDNPRMKIKILE